MAVWMWTCDTQHFGRRCTAQSERDCLNLSIHSKFWGQSLWLPGWTVSFGHAVAKERTLDSQHSWAKSTKPGMALLGSAFGGAIAARKHCHTNRKSHNIDWQKSNSSRWTFTCDAEHKQIYSLEADRFLILFLAFQDALSCICIFEKTGIEFDHSLRHSWSFIVLQGCSNAGFKKKKIPTFLPHPPISTFPWQQHIEKKPFPRTAFDDVIRSKGVAGVQTELCSWSHDCVVANAIQSRLASIGHVITGLKTKLQIARRKRFPWKSRNCNKEIFDQVDQLL